MDKFSFNPIDVLGPQHVFKGSDVFSLVGQRGFFGNTLEAIQSSIENNGTEEASVGEAVLDCVFLSNPAPFKAKLGGSTLVDCHSYALFLPAAKVKGQDPEQDFRPCKSYEEFLGACHINNIGDLVKLKSTLDGHVLEGMFTGVAKYPLKVEMALGFWIGGKLFYTEELFENYKVYNSMAGQWEEIGVNPKI